MHTSEKCFWTTSEAAPSKRVAYWNEAICEAIFELEFAASETALDAELRQRRMGPIRLSRLVINTSHAVTRSRRAIARSATQRFNLNYILSGGFTVIRGGEEIRLAAGECILLDSREPYRVVSAERAVHASLHLPPQWLGYWLPRPERLVGCALRPGTQWYRALAACIEEAATFSAIPESMHSLCADQIAGAFALAADTKARAPAVPQVQKLYQRLHDAMTEMASDPQLDASAVAAAVPISLRYLHKILAQFGTTYSHLLCEIRLARAAHMLMDRRFNDLPVTEIAWRSGFRDPSHFSRRFRERFGHTPGSFRQAQR